MPFSLLPTLKGVGFSPGQGWERVGSLPHHQSEESFKAGVGWDVRCGESGLKPGPGDYDDLLLLSKKIVGRAWTPLP